MKSSKQCEPIEIDLNEREKKLFERGREQLAKMTRRERDELFGSPSLFRGFLATLRRASIGEIYAARRRQGGRS